MGQTAITAALNTNIEATGTVRPRVFRSLQAARGVAALMVVFFHCEKLMSLGKYWHSIHHYFYFGSSGVDFFFVLSGIVILFAHEAQIGCPQHLPEYAWKRFRRIYPIYWCVLLLALAVYFVVPAFGNGTKTTPGVILGSIMLLPLTSTETVLPVAWTLFHEIMFYLVFSLFLVRRSIGIATLFLWLAGSLFALIFQFPSSLLQFYLSPLHLLFAFGLVIPYLTRRLQFNGMALAIAAALLFLGLGILEDLFRPINPVVPILYGLLSAILASGLIQMERAGRLRVPQALVFLGDASYSLYLIHYMALSAGAKVLFQLWLRRPFPLPVVFVVLLCIALGAGIGLHLALERVLLKLLPRKLSANA